MARHATLAAVTGLGHSAILFAFVLVAGGRAKNLTDEIQDLDFEIDLKRYKTDDRETRAEKLLRINTTQLRRYYELNLQQNQWMFGLGIGCILLGVVLITQHCGPHRVFYKACRKMKKLLLLCSGV